MPSSVEPIFSLAELAQACRFGRVNDVSRPAAQRTGFNELDRALPIGGWPIGALTEIMPHTEGIGELRLVMPALAALSREQRYVAFIAPPYLPYPPALVQQGIKLEQIVLIEKQTLASSLWAAEQMLRCAAFGAVLIWPASIGDKESRRLQLAAEAGQTLAIIYRPPSAARTHSPAALRLCLHPDKTGLRIEIKKCRGGHAGQIVHCTTSLLDESDANGADDTPINHLNNRVA